MPKGTIAEICGAPHLADLFPPCTASAVPIHGTHPAQHFPVLVLSAGLEAQMLGTEGECNTTRQYVLSLSSHSVPTFPLIV